jgi:hypothetical protein
VQAGQQRRNRRKCLGNRAWNRVVAGFLAGDDEIDGTGTQATVLGWDG